MGMVQNGDILTYAGQWSTGGIFQTVSDLLQTVVKDLNNSGLAVRHSQVNQSVGQVIGAAGWGGNFAVQIDLQVENGLGYAQPDDVRSIVDGYVVQEGGTVTGSSIPYVQSASGGGPVPTGQPGADQTTKQAGCIAGTSNDLTGSFSVGCWFSGLTSSGLSTVGLLAIIMIVGLILLSKAERTLT